MMPTSYARLIDNPALGIAFAPHHPRRSGAGSPQPQRRRPLPASRMKATLDKLKQGLQGNGEPGAQGLSVRNRCPDYFSNCGGCAQQQIRRMKANCDRSEQHSHLYASVAAHSTGRAGLVALACNVHPCLLCWVDTGDFDCTAERASGAAGLRGSGAGAAQDRGPRAPFRVSPASYGRLAPSNRQLMLCLLCWNGLPS